MPMTQAIDDSQTPVKSAKNQQWKKVALPVIGILALLAAVGGFLYWQDQQKYVYTDKASLSAPIIQLTPKTAGILMDVFVKDGDYLPAHKAVARVGGNLISTEIPGLALEAKKDIGAQYNPGQAVVTMIDPKEMRVVALVEEDKGLKEIKAGQKALFTVDAFGSEQFEGTVESVSNTNHAGDVVFNISDKRAEQQFAVKIQYDTERYPQFQNGMSAKVWIVK